MYDGYFVSWHLYSGCSQYDTIMIHKLAYNPLKRINELRVSVQLCFSGLPCSAFAMHVQCPTYFFLVLPFVSAIFHYSRMQNIYYGYHHTMFGFVLCMLCCVCLCGVRGLVCVRFVCHAITRNSVRFFSESIGLESWAALTKCSILNFMHKRKTMKRRLLLKPI